MARFWAPALLLGLLLLLAASGVASQERPSVRDLWERATAAAVEERWDEAASHFERLHREFSRSEFAEESLWRAAQMRRKAAEQEKDPDWERVRDLFHRYSTEYPAADHRDEAHLEIGISYFRMRFFREALTYFRLFAQRYADYPLLPLSRYWQAITLLEVGRVEEAVPLLNDLTREPDEELRLKALFGLRQAYEIQGEHLLALTTLERIVKISPADYHLENPELLLMLGLANGRLGREEEAREQLWRFVNLSPLSPRRTEALFALGESYYRQGDHAPAQRLYQRVVDEGGAGERAVVLARFRQAQFLDDPVRQQEQWRPRRDPADRVGDYPYLAVIDQYGLDPIAQEARYGLLLRLKARGDLEEALEQARAYIRHAAPQEGPGFNPGRTGDLLVFLIEELLRRGEYERIHHLYINEHQHVRNYQPGRLRVLIGRAMEELALYEQAAVVYYRALAGTLSDQELAELYYRRVLVYFALGDFAAADRLLTHLRRIYAEQPARLAEAQALSGTLRARQQRHQEAWGFFRQALASPEAVPRWGEALPSLLRTMAALELFNEMPSVLARGLGEGWLGPELAQAWYRRSGDGLRRLGLTDQAQAVYGAGLAEAMPREGEDFQAISFHLGALLAKGDQPARDEARRHLAAAAGPDQLLGKMARQQLNQLDIVEATEGMRSLFTQ
ncbi:tetratricopeptide repeat protein [Desulfurivibrio sp. D14AmB]|uniref:tetratricopeptide repeat protein n=1 Tax=Desulfurivibrio sp. D14AmB TaxID=3374370 RepID=UPI00376EE783